MKMPPLPVAAESRVEMIPLIDVVFLVLVAFIYASAFLSPKVGLPVDLPQAAEAESERAEIATVTIDRDGNLFLGEQPVSVSELPRALQRVKREGITSVYIKADRRARLDHLVRVMDICRAAKMDGLTIATRRRVEATSVP